MLDIFDLGIIASLIAAIVFIIKEKQKETFISIIILLSLLVIKNIT